MRIPRIFSGRKSNHNEARRGNKPHGRASHSKGNIAKVLIETDRDVLGFLGG
jgi:hypothetical protein